MTASTEHTAGPWHTEPWSYENGKRVVTTIQTDKDAITQVCDLWPPDEREDEKQANIRLMVAAPDLLEALRNTLSSYRAATCNHPDDQIRNTVIREAESAIAKAEGREP